LTFLWIILWVLAIVAAIRIYVSIVVRVLTVHRYADQVHFVTTDDGWTLALHHYLPAEPKFAEPVVLCHGLGANRFNFDLIADRSLARALAERGFDVWSLELRGHGLSSRPGWFTPFSWGFTFDDFLDKDIPAALELVKRLSGQPQVFWLGHSMGGMLGYALAGDEKRDDLAGLVTVGAPVRLDRSFGIGRLKLLTRLLGPARAVMFRPLSRFFAPMLGRAPEFLSQPMMLAGSMEPRVVRRAMVNLVENASAALVRQMMGWARKRNFASTDGQRDYMERLSNIDMPVLLVAAERDGLASPQSVSPAYERIRSSDKQLRVFGIDAGDDSDFGHGDVLLGTLAPKLVHVEIADWLQARASDLAEKTTPGPERESEP
jgi:pimeloyl-ACP methyl ester carboxylesterase